MHIYHIPGTDLGNGVSALNKAKSMLSCVGERETICKYVGIEAVLSGWKREAFLKKWCINRHLEEVREKSYVVLGGKKTSSGRWITQGKGP